ncbi:ABC-three component system protein [uncultured Salinisphaera sp.]|uniref:ABC-three component system protein n=1 Tax=uncultured Salinisphaera sp. TaxID=359372 RepID=UPI0032B1213A|tara:strand:+ start:361 stop:1578 length:1218 start_codon:yes stop_codon:yes gene_type:complete
MEDPDNTSHSAEGPALGFWYQSLYALLILLEQSSDDAAVGIELLDDIQLSANGQGLYYQLKHSVAAKPSSVGIKSSSLWRTIKVWIDLLPKVNLPETSFRLVTVGGVVDQDPLAALAVPDSNREALVSAMALEARRVVAARAAAKSAGKYRLPYADRKDGCEAFLSCPDATRLNLLRRVTLEIESPTVSQIEDHISAQLKLLPVEQRAQVARKLIEWWDRQIVCSLCGKRERLITRPELQAQISEIVSDLEQGKLSADFETVDKPLEYQPDGMLTRQIALVNGSNTDINKAIREEWRARAQRARWVTENPALATMISGYDAVLTEHWSDKHDQMVEECETVEEGVKRKSGLDLLRWSHNEAPMAIRPIQEGFGASYYVRGSYQVLAIDLQVGWHPNYKKLLKDGE